MHLSQESFMFLQYLYFYMNINTTATSRRELCAYWQHGWPEDVLVRYQWQLSNNAETGDFRKLH